MTTRSGRIITKKRKYSESSFEDDEDEEELLIPVIPPKKKYNSQLKAPKVAKKVTVTTVTKKLKVKPAEPSTSKKIAVIKESKETEKPNVIVKSEEWNVVDLLGEFSELDQWRARNIVKLFDDENTIPFICRYRKEMIGDMDPER